MKYISLTFDDGPTVGITDQVLDILEEEKVTASFFLIADRITPDTEYLMKRALSLGCTLENHSRRVSGVIWEGLLRRMERRGFSSS